MMKLPPAEVATTVAQWVGAVLAVPLLVVFLTRLGSDRRPKALFLVGCAAVPTLALMLVSLYKPLFDPRFASIFWASAVTVLGAGLAAFRWRWVGVAAIGVLAVAALASLLETHNPDFEALSAPIVSHRGPGDLVVVNGPNHYFSMAYALGPAAYPSIKVVAGDIPWYFGVAGYAPDTHVRQVPDTGSRIYLVTDAGEPDPALPAGFRRVDHSCQGTACLDTYSR